MRVLRVSILRKSIIFKEISSLSDSIFVMRRHTKKAAQNISGSLH